VLAQGVIVISHSIPIIVSGSYLKTPRYTVDKIRSRVVKTSDASRARHEGVPDSSPFNVLKLLLSKRSNKTICQNPYVYHPSFVI
jgi:hypothetical protein